MGRGRGAGLTTIWNRDPALRHRGTETTKLTQEQKIIRAKIGLLELAKSLGVSHVELVKPGEEDGD